MTFSVKNNYIIQDKQNIYLMGRVLHFFANQVSLISGLTENSCILISASAFNLL